MKTDLKAPDLPFGYGTPEYFSVYKVGLANGKFDIYEARRDSRVVGAVVMLLIEAVGALLVWAIRSF